MPVRLRITILFTCLVFVILAAVALSVYYFSYTSRIDTVKTRLKNRAITVAGLLSRSDIFHNELVRRIDSATSIALVNKVMEAYDYKNHKIYGYSSHAGDTLAIDKEVLDEARLNGEFYYTVDNKDVLAYYFTRDDARFVMIAAGEDYEGKQNLYRLRKILLLSFSFGLLIALCGGYFFSEGLLTPIRKIADEVNAISAQNFSRRIRTGKVKDEWHYMSETFNALLDRLQESFNLQKRFISNASHELSTPLTSISSQIEVSLQRERVAGEYKEVLKSIHQDVQHMAKLTQMLLQLAKTSEDAGGLQLSPVRIDDVIFRIPAEIAKVNTAYAVSFDLEELPAEEDRLLVFGNEELLCAAIKNVVVNACKYSSNRLAVIKLVTTKDEITLSINDTGAGIPQEEFSHIFEPFYRATESGIKEGFGLGLSLVLRIIKLHKGNIEVRSKVGEGTSFSITLPIAK